MEGGQGLFLHGVLVVAHHVLCESLADIHRSHKCEVKAVLAHQRLELLTCELLLALDRLTPAPLAVEILHFVWYLGEEKALVKVLRKLLHDEVVRRVQLLQSFELALVVFVWELLVVLEHCITRDDARDVGHVLERLEELGGPAVDATRLLALHQLEEEAGFVSLVAAAVEDIE